MVSRDPDAVKEKILLATICLIEKSDGDVSNINTRAIAKSANVGVGLVNYHFKSKDNLIELCIQRIISDALSSSMPLFPKTDGTAIENLKHNAKLIFDFFILNPALSKIAIFIDLRSPTLSDITIKSIVFATNNTSSFTCTKEEQMLLFFTLLSTMQGLFLRKGLCKDLFGFDFHEKDERDKVLDFIIDAVFGSAFKGSDVQCSN